MSGHPKCVNCGGKIRWTETMGWVHGGLGEGYDQLCYVGATTEAEWDYDTDGGES